MVETEGIKRYNTAKKAVDAYLKAYNNLSDEVLNDLNKVVEEEKLNDSQKEVYKEILQRQYKDLKYEIIGEIYNADEASVQAKIEVYDLNLVKKQASEYLKNNIKHFYDDKGSYDNNRYLNYKLDLMNSTKERVNHIIEFKVIKTNEMWQIKEITSTDLEKIHGIYNYEEAY